MIKLLSYNISSYLCRELNYDQYKEEELSYGLQILLGISLKILSIFIVSYLLGILKTTSIALVSFIIFRMIIGGTHYNTYNKCFLASTSLVIILGFIGEVIELQSNTILELALLVYVQAVISTIIWVPVGTKKKAIKSRKLRAQMKMISIILSTGWLFLMFFMKDVALYKYAVSSIIGVFLAFFLITPLAYGFIK